MLSAIRTHLYGSAELYGALKWKNTLKSA